LRSSPLLLPTEILIQIFYHADPLDQLSLALTSKNLLQISPYVSLKTLSPTGHRALCSCRKMEELLRRVKPLDARGRPKRTWAVCCDCLRYRPTRKSYWKGKRKDWGSTDIWEYKVESWNRRSSLQCPECWCEEWRAALRIPDS
jgi:hypothetical protein